MINTPIYDLIGWMSGLSISVASCMYSARLYLFKIPTWQIQWMVSIFNFGSQFSASVYVIERTANIKTNFIMIVQLLQMGCIEPYNIYSIWHRISLDCYNFVSLVGLGLVPCTVYGIYSINIILIHNSNLRVKYISNSWNSHTKQLKDSIIQRSNL